MALVRDIIHNLFKPILIYHDDLHQLTAGNIELEGNKLIMILITINYFLMAQSYASAMPEATAHCLQSKRPCTNVRG